MSRACSRKWTRSWTFGLVAASATMMCGDARAVELIGVTDVTLQWQESEGDVDSYGVYVVRNGEARPQQPTFHVEDTRASISGMVGDSFVVWVAAFDEHGMHGPLSPASESFELVAGHPVVSLYAEDFDGHGDGEDPEGWLDTGAKNALSEDAKLFGAVLLSDGSLAFGTSSRLTNIHSHFATPQSAEWSAYEFAGVMAIDDPEAGIGVTVYSEYPVSDGYYRLRRYGDTAFHLSSHPDGTVKCEGATDTGFVPRADQWVRFRFQAFPEAGATRLRARVWAADGVEPDVWQVDCVDRAESFGRGAPGVWSLGRGLKLWDELEVLPLGPGGELIVGGAPAAPEEPQEPVGDGSSSDPEPASEPDPILFAEGFERYRDGEDPAGWFDTGADNALGEQDSLFGVLALEDGTHAFGTSSTETNIHSHLLIPGSRMWSAYEFSGAFAIDHRKGGVGVTLYSDYPDSDAYYRLRRTRGTTFHLSSHPDSRIDCWGATDTGVEPRPDVWYRFRFRAVPESSGSRIRAKVWERGAAEPGAWQVDCLDAAGTFQKGAPGVWSMGRGLKLWDDLEVREVVD